MARYTLASESIHFQDDEKLFKQLSDKISLIRTNKKLNSLSDKKFYESTELEELAGIIKKHTKISVFFEESGSMGPAVYTPTINKNHVFYTTDNKELYEFFEHDTEEDIKKLMRAVKKKIYFGSVDLVKGQVHGAFEQMEFKMLMPKTMFMQSQFTAEEVAAVMLHETGHIFTFCEFVNRTMSTNQVISNLLRVNTSSITDARKEVIFRQAAAEMKMTKEETEALAKAQRDESIAVIVLGRHAEESISELGYNAYDVNSCEYLADQFSTRQGAGRHLVTGLDKIFKQYGQTNSGIFWGEMILFLYTFILIVLTGGLAALIMVPLIIFAANKENNIYDSSRARMNRIEHQIIERLKDKNISDELRTKLLEEQEVIAKVSSEYSDKLSIIEGIAYYIRPGYRKAHKLELLQKQLESFANNTLFVNAAQFQSV
jgi:hypothetical protein